MRTPINVDRRGNLILALGALVGAVIFAVAIAPHPSYMVLGAALGVVLTGGAFGIE